MRKRTFKFVKKTPVNPASIYISASEKKIKTGITLQEIRLFLVRPLLAVEKQLYFPLDLRDIEGRL
jgi:hypothetical protein